MQHKLLDGRVIVKTGDITLEDTDAIVNAANATLLGGGGVDGAIHAKGGNAIYNECKLIRETRYPNGLPTGQAVITTGGNLLTRFVIHTVGPIYGMNNGRDAELLAESYKNSLELAAENDLKSIAFPSISTGAYYFPKHEAAKVVSNVLTEWLQGDSMIEQVRLVFFSQPDADLFLRHSAL